MWKSMLTQFDKMENSLVCLRLKPVHTSEMRFIDKQSCTCILFTIFNHNMTTITFDERY